MGCRRRRLAWVVLGVGGMFVAASGASVARGAEAAEEGDLESRTWTDSTGSYQTEAAMIDYVKGNVRLKRMDGQVREVPLSKLSRADQRYVREELARRRAREKEGAAERSPAGGSPSGEWPGWRGANRDGKSPDTGLAETVAGRGAGAALEGGRDRQGVLERGRHRRAGLHHRRRGTTG